MPPATSFTAAAASSFLEAHESRISELEEESGRVQTNVAVAQAEIKGVKESVDEVKELVVKSIDANKTAFDGLKTQVTHIDTRLVALEGVRKTELDRRQRIFSVVKAGAGVLAGGVVVKFADPIWTWLQSLVK